MHELLIAIFTHPAINAVTFLLGFLLADLLSLGRDRRKEFNAAAAIFRSAFTDQDLLLRENVKTGSIIPSEIIHSDVLVVHEKAKIVFEPFVTTFKSKAFNAAWEDYKNSENVYIQQTPMKNQNIRDFKHDLSKIYLVHINKLLDFAKPK